jgi:uncharacterized cupredoxin-like copper-binding protein
VRGALHRLVLLAIAGLAVLAVAACSERSTADRAGRTVRVTERDFHISAPKRVPAGDLTLAVDNKGPDHHELLLVRGRGRKLPLRGDGLTVDEDGLGSAVVAALEPAERGAHLLEVHLTPGHYRLICNMSGHYMGGMETDLVAE